MKLLVPVPFRIHTVQCKRHDRQCICIDRIFRPCRIDFRRHDIFDIVRVPHIIVGGGGVLWQAVMHDDILWYDDTAQDDLAALVHRFDLIFWYFGRIFPI